MTELPELPEEQEEKEEQETPYEFNSTEVRFCTITARTEQLILLKQYDKFKESAVIFDFLTRMAIEGKPASLDTIYESNAKAPIENISSN